MDFDDSMTLINTCVLESLDNGKEVWTFPLKNRRITISNK